MVHVRHMMMVAALAVMAGCSSSSGGSGGSSHDGGTANDTGAAAQDSGAATADAPGPTGCTADTDCASGDTCDTTTGFCMPMTGTTCHQCACVDTLAMGGCADVCDDAQNGNPSTPNFCNMVNALPQCAKCLMDSCAAAGADPTDPVGCM